MPPSLTAPAWCLHPSLCLSRASLHSGTQEGTQVIYCFHEVPVLARSTLSPVKPKPIGGGRRVGSVCCKRTEGREWRRLCL